MLLKTAKLGKQTKVLPSTYFITGKMTKYFNVPNSTTTDMECCYVIKKKLLNDQGKKKI